MKVAFFMTTILEKGGGLEKYLIETASYLANHVGLKVDIITMDEKFTRNYISILNFYYLKKISSKNIINEPTELIVQKLGKAKYKTIKNLKELKTTLQEYDVIYSKNEIVEAFIFKFIIGYKNIPPVIFGVHTPHHYPITKSLQSKLHNLLYEGWLYNFFCSQVKAFHTSNRDSLERLSSQFPKKKIYLIHYPFDSNMFINQKKESEFQIFVDNNKFNILWLGKLIEQKGVEDLIKLIEHFDKSNVSDKIIWHICGIGQPKYEKFFENISHKKSSVKYYRYVKNVNVPYIMKNMNIFLSTSKWEVSPYNIMEAQSSNLPVIAYNIPGPHDIVINNSTGYLCNTYNEMKKSIHHIIKKPSKFNKISEKFQNKFKPDIIYPQLLKMFENVKN